MFLNSQRFRSGLLCSISIFLLLLLMAGTQGCAETIPMDGVAGHTGDWDLENSPSVGIGLFPTVVIEPMSSKKSTVTPAGSGSVWVTISPFTATLSGQVTNMVAGYLSGERVGATVTIAGKRASDADFLDITTIKPDENGLFIWAVPADQSDVALFRVTAKTGSDQAISNAIRFTAGGQDPVIQPVVSPRQTPVPMVSGGTTTPSLTRLTLSASTTTPAVGEQVTISGRLTDGAGKGVSGADIAIDEDGYPGARGSEPFVTTRTGSDGRFEHSLSVSFADSVGLVARFEGDDTHNPAESNTIFFTAHQA